MGNKDNSNVTEGARKEFKISAYEHEPFNGIMSTKFISSVEFCEKVSDLFKAAFSDCEGCKYVINQQGLGYIALYFNHSEKSDGSRHNGVTRTMPDKNSNHPQNDTVKRIRMNDLRNRSGDRYYLTQDGMDGIDDFIYDSMVNKKDGKVMWDKIVAEVGTNQVIYNQPPVVYTAVSMLDPVKLAAEIFGYTDSKGNLLAYDVSVMRSMPQMVSMGNFQTQYMLAIKCVSDKEVCDLCNKLGVAPSMGFDIIK